MQFHIVDLKTKGGTAWYTLRPDNSEGIFELQCSLPEVNYTSSMAVTYALFLSRPATIAANPLFDLTAIGADHLGTMMRTPHPSINLTCFEGISQIDESVWQNV